MEEPSRPKRPLSIPAAIEPEILGRIDSRGQLQAPAPMPKPPMTLGRKILAGAVVVGGVLAVGFLVKLLFGGSPEKPAEKTADKPTENPT